MFSEKILIWEKMAHPHNSGSVVRIFFKILHNERSQKVEMKMISIFSKKKLGQMDHFGPKSGASS